MDSPYSRFPQSVELSAIESYYVGLSKRKPSQAKQRKALRYVRNRRYPGA